MQEIYTPEGYWDEVAQRVGQREESVVLAGDEEPYYRYKRSKFLRLLESVPFNMKKVIEIGSGPGGNLIEIDKKKPAELYGVDISEKMIDLARGLISGKDIHLLRINGRELPFSDNYFDISLTSTVLQHIVDDITLTDLIKNICRVTISDIYVFERIEMKRKVSATNIGRTLGEYSVLFGHHGFFLNNTRFLNVHWSYMACGATRKIFNARKRREGEPVSRISRQIQKCLLFVTKIMDNLFPVNRDLAMLHFVRTEPGREL